MRLYSHRAQASTGSSESPPRTSPRRYDPPRGSHSARVRRSCTPAGCRRRGGTRGGCRWNAWLQETRPLLSATRIGVASYGRTSPAPPLTFGHARLDSDLVPTVCMRSRSRSVTDAPWIAQDWAAIGGVPGRRNCGDPRVRLWENARDVNVCGEVSKIRQPMLMTSTRLFFAVFRERRGLRRPWRAGNICFAAGPAPACPSLPYGCHESTAIRLWWRC